MAERIEEQIISQRQLITDLSHELRVPLTRLDIAIEAVQAKRDAAKNLTQVTRESRQIRLLAEDALALAWLDNERPVFSMETSALSISLMCLLTMRILNFLNIE